MEPNVTAPADSGSASSSGESRSTDTSTGETSSASFPPSASQNDPASGNSVQGEPTPQQKATEEAKKYKYKLNIKGQEEEVEYDEQSLVKELQKARAASKIREEAARYRQEADQEKAQIAQEREQFKQIVEALKNPQSARQLLRQIGTPLEELSKAELEDYIQQQQMTPEQRELQQLRSWKQQQEHYQQQQEQQRQQQEYEQQVQAAQEQFAGRIVAAMTKLGLSENDARSSGELAQRLAFKLEQALNAGYSDITPDELAEEVLQDLQEQHRVLYGKLPGDKIFQMWGEEGLKKAQQYATSRVPQVPSVDNPPKKAATGPLPAGAALPSFKTRQEWNDLYNSINNTDPVEE
jgi:hypothetical protein